MLVDLALLAAGVGAGAWLATRWRGFGPAERWGNVLLVAALCLSGGVGLAVPAGRTNLVGQALAGLAALGGFYLLVVRGSGVPRPAAEQDPADVPEDADIDVDVDVDEDR
ncbi:MAG: hypothetical protein ABEJ43_05345 [Haloferacaceae archaeon]